MSKVITNFTTDLDFRRAINKAGGNLKIDSTPEQMVNALRAVGGEAGFDSPFETVLDIVNGNSPEPTPVGNFQIKIASGATDFNEGNPAPYIRVSNTNIEYPEEYWVTLPDAKDTYKHELKNEAKNMISITLNDNVHLTSILLFDKYGTAGIENNIKFWFDESEEEATNAMFAKYPNFAGVPVSLHINEGLFTRAGKTSAEFNMSFNFGTSVPPLYIDETTEPNLPTNTVAEDTISKSDVQPASYTVDEKYNSN